MNNVGTHTSQQLQAKYRQYTKDPFRLGGLTKEEWVFFRRMSAGSERDYVMRGPIDKATAN